MLVQQGVKEMMKFLLHWSFYSTDSHFLPDKSLVELLKKHKELEKKLRTKENYHFTKVTGIVPTTWLLKQKLFIFT